MSSMPMLSLLNFRTTSITWSGLHNSLDINPSVHCGMSEESVWMVTKSSLSLEIKWRWPWSKNGATCNRKSWTIRFDQLRSVATANGEGKSQQRVLRSDTLLYADVYRLPVPKET